MDCFNCEDYTGNYKADKEICGKCRKVLKVDIVRSLLGTDRVYLSEANRNKDGRPSSLTADQENDIKNDHKRGMSFGEMAKKYKVNKSSIYNVVNKK